MRAFVFHLLTPRVVVGADTGLDAVYDDLAKKAYDTCMKQAKDKPMRRACGILQEVVWDCWNGHVRNSCDRAHVELQQVVIQTMELSSPEVMNNLLLPTSKMGYVRRGTFATLINSRKRAIIPP